MNVMLATDLDPSDPMFQRLLTDNRWAAERKYDGRRAVATTDHGTLRWAGRDGRKFIPGAAHQQAVSALGHVEAQLGRTVLDGELMADGRYVIFDVIEIDHVDMTESEWANRSIVVRALVAGLSNPMIDTPDLAFGEEPKRALWDHVVHGGYEGIVLKRVDAEYQHGRSRAWLKAKVTATAELIVLSRDATSCRLGTWHDGKIVEVCGAAVQPGLDTQITVGTVVEVRYLYADKHLVQPRIVRVRTDKDIDGLTPWTGMRQVSR